MAENSSTELLLGLCLHYDVGVWPCSVKPLECVSTPTPAKSGSASWCRGNPETLCKAVSLLGTETLTSSRLRTTLKMSSLPSNLWFEDQRSQEKR